MLKKTALFFCLAVLACTSAYAQLNVRIRISQANYLQYEPIFVQVSIRNHSAHAVAFGENETLQGKLYFEIKHEKKYNVSYVPLFDKNTTPPLTGSIIPPGATREYTFQLRDYYDIRELGDYSIRAVLRHNMFDVEYFSKDSQFRVTRGSVIWQSTVGVPDTVGIQPDKKVNNRTYKVVSYNTGRAMVYNLIIEDEKKLYANRRLAFDLGPELRPQCKIDFLSRLNIILPASTKVYAYYQFNVDGQLEKKKIMMKTSTTPSLVEDPKTGYVTIVGGREAQRDLDYEEIKDKPFIGVTAESMRNAPPKGHAVKDLNAVPE